MDDLLIPQEHSQSQRYDDGAGRQIGASHDHASRIERPSVRQDKRLGI